MQDVKRRPSYDGGVLYIHGTCGFCSKSFHLSLGRTFDSLNRAQHAVEANACPVCLDKITQRHAAKQNSIRDWQLQRHCANLSCGLQFTASGLPLSGEVPPFRTHHNSYRTPPPILHLSHKNYLYRAIGFCLARDAALSLPCLPGRSAK